jgi:diguanylate cyclase (GGDEF)-like protein/PAS domain S-box-containing protein
MLDRGRAMRLEPEFFRRHIVQILAWPVLCIFLIGGVWLGTIWKIDVERAAAENRALQDAAGLCRDYAQYLSQVIEQAGQITLQLKYDWEQSHGKLDLQKLSRSGIYYRNPQIINILIVDRDGKPATASGSMRPNITYADREYFLFHKNDGSDTLLIGKPIVGRLSGKPLITFTRRLTAPNGSFDGVAMFSVAPSYLTSFYGGSYPGKNGLLAVIGLDGTMRSAKIGAAVQDSMPTALRAVPLFATSAGAARMSGEPWFDDKQARFVAWRELTGYPLVAMVGLSQPDYLSPYHEAWTTYKVAAVFGSILLFLFGSVATAVSIRLAQKRFQDEEVRKAYRIATEGGDEGFYMYEAMRDSKGAIVDFTLVDCNQRGAEFYGLSQAEMLKRKLSDFYPPPFFEDLMGAFRTAMASGFLEEELRLPRESKIRIKWAKRRLVRSGNGLAVTIQDVSQRKLAEERIEFLAHHDPLTHLPNRVLFRDRFEHAMATAVREETEIAVLFLDLDHFKQVNDNFGHQIGDRLLIEVVKRLRDCVRDSDTICRQGGDEFIVLLTNIRDFNDIGRVAQSMLDAISEPIEIESQTFHTSASIGIVLFPDDGSDFDTLLKNADTAMYEAKDGGRNTYRFFTARMNTDVMERLRLYNDLRVALQKNEFQLHYQPQVDLLTGRVVGMEALIRWYHPTQGLILPARFIPVAEASGQIVPIGEWVLQQACQQARIWEQGGQGPFRVAVNLSALQFKRGNMLDTVEEALARSGLPPGMLELELTESILLQDLEAALKTIADLKTLGVQLSIDDFGTGYSSLSYLKQLKVDKLKVDRSFVRDLVNDVDDMAIVRAIIQLGKTLQLRVNAEGVETIEQLQFLREHGCDEAQGYYFCRPLSAPALSAWLADRKPSDEPLNFLV